MWWLTSEKLCQSCPYKQKQNQNLDKKIDLVPLNKKTNSKNEKRGKFWWKRNSKLTQSWKLDANLLSFYQSKYSKNPIGSNEVLEEWKMSSNVTLAESGIGFCILYFKICVKLSGIYRNKNLTNKLNLVLLNQKTNLKKITKWKISSVLVPINRNKIKKVTKKNLNLVPLIGKTISKNWKKRKFFFSLVPIKGYKTKILT